MKKITSKFGLMALLVACMLTACSNGNDDSIAETQMNDAKDIVQSEVFEGEWTVDKEVVDTACLEVTSVLKVRLPEAYLTGLCFKEVIAHWNALLYKFSYTGQPVMFPLRNEGSTSNASFHDVTQSETSYNDARYFINASYDVLLNSSLNGTYPFRLELLSKEPASAVYRNDNGLWTIALPVSTFLVTDLDNQTQGEIPLPAPVTLYYNATKRIR